MSLTNPPHNVLFSLPRTASHLLVRLLNLPGQPSITRPLDGEDGYHFLLANFTRFKRNLSGKDPNTWNADDETALKQALQTGFDAWTALLREAQALGKATYIKEHLNFLIDPVSEARFFGYTQPSPLHPFEVIRGGSEGGRVGKSELNVTCIPDDFLLREVRPTFLIRHPCLVFPSLLRTALTNQSREAVLREELAHRWECTYHWTLSLYRFYVQHPSFERESREEGVLYPIVIDAADLGGRELLRKYASAVGLEKEKMLFEWEAARGEDPTGLKQTIMKSTGIVKAKLGADVKFDLTEEKRGWETEFGEVLAERLFMLASSSMRDYEELRAVRMRV